MHCRLEICKTDGNKKIKWKRRIMWNRLITIFHRNFAGCLLVTLLFIFAQLQTKICKVLHKIVISKYGCGETSDVISTKLRPNIKRNIELQNHTFRCGKNFSRDNVKIKIPNGIICGADVNREQVDRKNAKQNGRDI